MKTARLFGKFYALPLALALGTATFTAGGLAEAQQTYTLSAITPYPADNYLSKPLFQFADAIEKATDGQVKVKYLGGAEVVPAFEQFDAVRNGTVDLALAPASYYTGSVPQAVGIQYNAKKLPGELRKVGYNALMEKLHLDEGGVIYLANASGTPGSAFRLYSAKPVKTTKDLAGMKFRVSPVYTALVEAMGATPVSMPPADTYSALERGIVDGLGWTYAGTLDYGFPEVAKYVIDPPFYSLNSSIIMNKKAWDKLPDHLQKKIRLASIQFEKDVVTFYADYISKEDAKLKAAGAVFVKFPKEDAKRYLDAAYGAGWAKFIKENPKYGPEIKKMMRE